jgi:enoyl-CoA hydratase
LDTILLARPSDDIAVLTLNRPDRLNAITTTMYNELEATLTAIADDRDIRVLVLMDAGRGFCSGQDLRDLGADPESSSLGRVQFGLSWQSRAAALVRQIHRLPQVVIAAVNGAAAGAGPGHRAGGRHPRRLARGPLQPAFVRIGLSGRTWG